MATIVSLVGFEMGLFNEVTSTTGTIAIDSGTVNTGAYSAKFNNTSAGDGYARINLPASNRVGVAKCHIYFTSLPSDNTPLLGFVVDTVAYEGAIFKVSDSKIYAGYQNAVGVGATGVSVTTGVWYLLDVKVVTSANPHTIDVKVDGTACGQCTLAVAADDLDGAFAGHIWGTSTAVGFIDDWVYSYTAIDYPLGNIRCAAVANPNANGQYSNFDTLVGGDGTNHYTSYDDPAGTALATMDDDYVEQAAKAAVADIANLESSAQIGLAAGDVIDAVRVMIYHKGTGDLTAGIRVRSNAGTDYDTATNGGTGLLWSSKYYALDPAGAAWTQANFDGFQAGKYTASHATNELLYCVMVFVAYHAGGTPNSASATVMIEHNLGTTTARLYYPNRSGTTMIKGQPAASRLATWGRTATSNAKIASIGARSWGTFASASASVSLTATASRVFGLARTATVSAVHSLSAARLWVAQRTATTDAKVAATASRLIEIVRTSPVAVVLATSASRVFGISRSAATAIVAAVSASRLWEAIRVAATGITASITASRTLALSLASNTAIAVDATAERIQALNKVASTISVAVTSNAERVFGLARSASTDIVHAVNASRIAEYARSATASIKLDTIAERIANFIRDATAAITSGISAAYTHTLGLPDYIREAVVSVALHASTLLSTIKRIWKAIRLLNLHSGNVMYSAASIAEAFRIPVSTVLTWQSSGVIPTGVEWAHDEYWWPATQFRYIITYGKSLGHTWHGGVKGDLWYH